MKDPTAARAGVNLRRIQALAHKEALQIIRDPSVLLIAFVLPVVMLFLFAYAVSLDIKKVPIGVVLESDGAAAQSLDACARAAGRLEEVTTAVPPVVDPPAPVPLPPGDPLTVEDVRVRFAPDGRWVLDGVSLAVEPGRCLALVGPSGAGKTTLADLLVRFRDPDAGAVRIGDVDLRDATQREVRAAVRLAAQDAHLFATSLRSNLALADPAADDRALAAALGRVGLGAWLAGLPGGLDTEVGERGARVSGGQRQRIAAARLLLGATARFLVLDEPTAHLDPAGARDLLAELARTARAAGQGVLVITHVLDGLDAVDEVLVLERGRIVERGAHADLLARGGPYAALVRGRWPTTA